MIDELAGGVLRGEERAIARACRLIDDRDPGATELLDALRASPRRARVIGVTGSPGSGKSTLVSGLVAQFRARAERVAVLAVDPSSASTGGAILGDRVRMQRHFADDGVFIRSLATRGAHGGLSRSAEEHVLVLEAAGFDVILLETVGVGQDELDVAEVAGTTVVVLAPGMGDDIQAVKSGILEIADIFVVNKADRDGADRAVLELEQRLELGRVVEAKPVSAGFLTPILKCVAAREEGLSELIMALSEHAAWLHTDSGRARGEARALVRARRLIFSQMHARMAQALGPELDRAAATVAARAGSPHAAAEDLCRILARKLSAS